MYQNVHLEYERPISCKENIVMFTQKMSKFYKYEDRYFSGGFRSREESDRTSCELK